MAKATPTYELIYWPSIQGRGEFVRLVLEDGGLPYVDVARGKGGIAALRRVLDDDTPGTPPYAPPVLRVGELRLAQTALICAYLAGPAGLLPADEADRLRAQMVMCTVMDHVVEAHDTHHPIANSLYYDEQKAEAKHAAELYLEVRLPKHLGYYEHVLSANAASGGKTLIGPAVSYPDLALFQLVDGLRYAFPNAMARQARQVPHVMALHEAVARRPRVAAYLASPRRLPFNEDGIFRHYPELDLPA